jgi:outer membrane protein assembly factor BamA
MSAMRAIYAFLITYGLLALGPPVHAGTVVQDEKSEKYPRISSIEVKGNSVQNSASIIGYTGLKVGDRATPTALLDAQRSIFQSGYFGMRRVDKPEDAVTLTLVEVNKAANESQLVITVEENDVVKSINITDNGPVSVKELLEQIRTMPNFVLNINTLRADVERIQKYYDGKGYIANVSEEGFGLTSGVLNIPIVVGRSGYGRVRVNGLSEARRKAVEREWNHVFKPGDYYNTTKFWNLMKKLEKMGIGTGMDDISPGDNWIPNPKFGVSVTLNLREKK